MTRICNLTRPGSLFLIAVFAAFLSACAATGWQRPPACRLNIPEAFRHNTRTTHFKTGEAYVNSPPYRLTVVAPMTELYGSYGGFAPGRANEHYWTVHVYGMRDAKVARALIAAKDGYDADLNEEIEFLDGGGSRAYLYARFEHKHFPWGEAVAFFSQSTQDTGSYVPNNGHLTYGVWGITSDGRHTVVASFGVSHPKLADWGPAVREVKTREAMRKDRDYRLVESCPPGDFTPGLTAIDRFVGSLRLAE